MSDSWDWYDLVTDELYSSESAAWDDIKEVRYAIHNWIVTKDPDYMDFLVIYCLQKKLPMTPTMLKFIAQAAESRITRDKDITNHYRRKSNFAKSGAIDIIMKEMMKMIHFCNLSEDRAALNGAKIWVNRFSYLGNRPASTIRQDYISWKKENADYIERVKRHRPEGWTEDEVKSYLQQFNAIRLKEFQIGEIR